MIPRIACSIAVSIVCLGTGLSADAVDLAETVGADIMTTRGLGHRRILRDPQVVQRVVAFIARDHPLTESA